MTFGAPARVESTADVDPRARIGDESVVWHLVQVREGAVVGRQTSLGRGAYVGPGVTIGDRVKVQNYALLYEPAVIEDGAFIGPAVVLTNDLHPRAITTTGDVMGPDDWEAVGVVVRTGASIGARSVVVAPVEVGAWAMVGAGAVVHRDVPAHALVLGVPAKQVGWVGRSGERLHEEEGLWVCGRTGERYRLDEGRMTLCAE